MTWPSMALCAALGLAVSACAQPPLQTAAPSAPRSEPATASSAAPDPVSIALSTAATEQELLAGIEAAYRAGRFGDGLALVRRTLETQRQDLSLYDQVGSIYYLLGRYGEALATWEQALKLEQRPGRRRDLDNSIAVARRTLGLPEPQGKPLRTEPRRRRTRKRKADPKLIESVYDQGVAYYAKGEYLQAASEFYRVLELDPDHALAKSALARLKLRPGASASPGSLDSGKNGNPG